MNYFEMAKLEITELKGNPASQAQIDMYHRLCEEKGLEPIDVSLYNGKMLYDLNSALMKYYPASPAQISRIKSSVEQLESAGVSLTLPDLSTLTGGRQGTASMIITKLDELLAQHQEALPPTEGQLDMLKDMFLCVDVPFEDFGISRRVTLEDGTWRKPTPEEFKDACSHAFSKSEASEFIGKHKGAFAQWKTTRVTLGQMDRIRQLESRLSDDSSVGVVPIAITIDGEEVQLAPERKEHVKGEAYVPLTDDMLLLFDKESASQYITQLEAELSRRKEWGGNESDTTFELIRTPDSMEEAIEVEYEKVDELLHQLEAVAGVDSEALEAFNINIIRDDSPGSYAENKAVIREFLTDLIDSGSIDFFTLMDFVKESRTLQRILLQV